MIFFILGGLGGWVLKSMEIPYFFEGFSKGRVQKKKKGGNFPHFWTDYKISPIFHLTSLLQI